MPSLKREKVSTKNLQAKFLVRASKLLKFEQMLFLGLFGLRFSVYMFSACHLNPQTFLPFLNNILLCIGMCHVFGVA